MLAELGGVTKIYIAVGYTDLRLGINGLAQAVGTRYDLNPFEKGVLFLSFVRVFYKYFFNLHYPYYHELSDHLLN